MTSGVFLGSRLPSERESRRADGDFLLLTRSRAKTGKTDADGHGAVCRDRIPGSNSPRVVPLISSCGPVALFSGQTTLDHAAQPARGLGVSMWNERKMPLRIAAHIAKLPELDPLVPTIGARP